MTPPHVLIAAWPQTAARIPKFLLIDAFTSRSRDLYCRSHGHMASVTTGSCTWCGARTT